MSRHGDRTGPSSRARRRRRAFVLLCLALASGGLAASEIRARVREVEARVGPLVPVVVAREDLRAGRRIGPRAAGRLLALREVPERFVPPDSLASPEEAVGLRAAVPLPAGAYVTAAQLEGAEPEPAGPRLRRGERAVEVAVAGGAALVALAGPGARVDVLVTTEGRSGAGRTFLALEDVELLDLRPADSATDAGGGGGAAGGEGSPGAGAAVATLRVTLRQAVFLTAAQSFARELRLLARPPGERRRPGRPIAAGGVP